MASRSPTRRSKFGCKSCGDVVYVDPWHRVLPSVYLNALQGLIARFLGELDKCSATAVLMALAAVQQDEGDTMRGRYSPDGSEIQGLVRLDPERINDAVELLETRLLVKVGRWGNTTPYSFASVTLTALGRLEAEQIVEATSTPAENAAEHVIQIANRALAELDEHVTRLDDTLDTIRFSQDLARWINMATPEQVTIVNVGYRSTNYWVISAGKSRLLVDLGWPGTMGQMRASLDRMGVPLNEIRYGLATHYHIDHAGLAEELKQAGVPLLVLDVQVDSIPLVKQHTKPRDNYVDIAMHTNVTISFDESRSLLERIGIPGEIVHTPGHSDDSVSLLLDDGSVFTGDLTHPALVVEADAAVVDTSWRLLRERGASRVYPAHGRPRPMHAESIV